jgi:DNA-binding CsgD family transcriptional regulator
LLFVSTHTVISHRKNISEKTGIKSASGLTMYAILKKIIDVNEINQDELI